MNKDIENRLKEYGEFEKNIDNIVVSSFDYSSKHLSNQNLKLLLGRKEFSHRVHSHLAS